MPIKPSGLTVKDQFCGAGGWAQAIKKWQIHYGGLVDVKVALNHWKLATDTYQANNENTLVECTDISACDPRRYPSTNILVTSPECTTWSPSGGNKHAKWTKQTGLFDKQVIDPSTERSRATMWDVCRFAEYHQYDAIILENVVEAKTGWVLFDEWLTCMHKLGYLHECCYLNSMHFWPTPQSRDRMYIVFWKKGNKKPNLNYMPLAYSPRIGKDVNAIQSWKPGRSFGKYRKQYVYCCPITGDVVEPYYYAAFNCIDWSIPTIRIGDRKTKLADKTILRIEHGLEKYGHTPYLADCAYSDNPFSHVRSLTDVHPSQTCRQTQQLAYHPFFTRTDNSSNPTANVRSSLDVVQTQTTTDAAGVCVPPPFMIELKGTSKSRSIEDPLSSATTVGYHGLITNDQVNSFLSAYNNGSHCLNNITDATGTIPTKHRFGLVQYNEKLKVDDCHYRMLQAHEVQKAMAFLDNYKVLGNQRDKIRQLGNAVTPPPAEWLFGQVAETLN